MLLGLSCCTLDARCMLISPPLMQNQLGRLSLIVCDERYLCINDLREEIVIAFGEYFYLPLSGCLGHEAITVTGHLENEIRRQLVTANVAIEYPRIDLRYLAL